MAIASTLMMCAASPVCAADGAADGVGNAAGGNNFSANADSVSAEISGHVSATSMIDDATQKRLGFTCSTDEDGKVIIMTVRDNSAAGECGLQPGDRLVNARLDGDVLRITIDRDGARYRAQLKEPGLIQRPPSGALTPQKDNQSSKPFTLSAEKFVVANNKLMAETGTKLDQNQKLVASASKFSLAIQKNAKLLAKYDIALIVDRSSSMRKPDCPGDMSRWDWCAQQAGSLAQALAPYAPAGLTLVPFASEYDVFEHATPKNVDFIFNNIGQQGGTRLYEPLAERLDTFFARYKPGSKPLLIVVVTDGVPAPRFEPNLVRNELVAASKRMVTPQQATVVFCQIGSDAPGGIRYLSDLGENLTSYGAKYQFVHTVLFDDCVADGLGGALVRAIQTYSK